MVIKFLQKSTIYLPFNLYIILTGLILLFELNSATLVISQWSKHWIFNVFCFVYDLATIWDFAWVATLGTAFNMGIMFTSYAVIHLLTQSLFSDCFLRQIHPERQIRYYRELQLFIGIVNDVFQDFMAGTSKLIIIVGAVFTGVILVNSHLRKSTQTLFLILSFYAMMVCYIVILVAYSFPGKVNSTSKMVKRSWRSETFHVQLDGMKRSRANIQKLKKYITSSRNIKIKFGPNNFYERGTAVNILLFVVENINTLALIL